MQSPLESQLVVRAMAGDQEALDGLWRANRHFVAAVLLAHQPRSSDLEDLLQDVAMKTVAQIHTLKAPAAFRPWLRTVARNVAMSHGRREKFRGGHAALDAELADPGHAREAQLDPVREQLEGMLEIVKGMHLDYREPLLMRAVEGMSQKAIAAALDVPVTTIETRLARARRMLRKELAARERAATFSPGRTGTDGEWT